MVSSLERDRERGSQTERREHLAARRVLGMAFDSGCQTTRFDPQGDPCRHGQTGNRRQSERAAAVLCSTPGKVKKKVCPRRSKREPMSLAPADVGYESKACLIPPGWGLLTRPPLAQKWWRSKG